MRPSVSRQHAACATKATLTQLQAVALGVVPHLPPEPGVQASVAGGRRRRAWRVQACGRVHASERGPSVALAGARSRNADCHPQHPHRLSRPTRWPQQPIAVQFSLFDVIWQITFKTNLSSNASYSSRASSPRGSGAVPSGAPGVRAQGAGSVGCQEQAHGTMAVRAQYKPARSTLACNARHTQGCPKRKGAPAQHTSKS